MDNHMKDCTSCVKKMEKDIVTVTLTKVSDSEHWGFRLAGGKDYGQPLSISQVSSGSLAADLGLTADDFLVNIDGKETYDLTHDQAEKAIYAAGNKFQMIIERGGGIRSIMDINKVFPKPPGFEEEERRR